ncbi:MULTISPECIES: hypothetical protein [Lactococcus]|uniref:hypothetical protein n=1 Tax=Lactococcus TaxID=1357 RepID=UPI00203E1A61|nr:MULTISPECIES: hypothetical protein [Lactococcus]
MKKGRISKKLDGVRKMPPSYHTIPGHEFSYEKSEVMNYLKNDDEAMNWFFRLMQTNELIVYDPNTGRWQGNDYEL